MFSLSNHKENLSTKNSKNQMFFLLIVIPSLLNKTLDKYYSILCFHMHFKLFLLPLNHYRFTIYYKNIFRL
jgi:hypothetical protein